MNRAQQRIEARRSQVSLKADIAQKCKALNQKKATLDINADVSANMNRLDLLKKELAELEEKVRTTKKLIEAEEASIANSKQETQEIAEQIQAEFAEISTLRVPEPVDRLKKRLILPIDLKLATVLKTS